MRGLPGKRVHNMEKSIKAGSSRKSGVGGVGGAGGERGGAGVKNELVRVRPGGVGARDKAFDLG